MRECHFRKKYVKDKHERSLMEDQYHMHNLIKNNHNTYLKNELLLPYFVSCKKSSVRLGQPIEASGSYVLCVLL